MEESRDQNLGRKKKRKRTPNEYGFRAFGEPGCPIEAAGPFRDNVRLFVQQCAEPESYRVHGMPIWCTLLRGDDDEIVPLYTIEEDVTTSLNPFCDHCRCTGWSNHFVSKRKYHLIIPMDDDWNKPLDDGVLDNSNHLLHGLIHCNGFGHLLCINGIEGGSKHLCGRELMDLWDRICITLRTRKITVEDVSKKRSMELRLLYGVAYGHPWFGKWGYTFLYGSFGIKEHIYERALEILSSLELDRIVQDFSDTEQCEELKTLVRHYRHLSETHLVTIKDLLRFMLTIKACFPAQRNSLCHAAKPADVMENAKPATREPLKIKPHKKEKCSKYRKFATVVSHTDSRWSARRLESVAVVIVNALMEKKEKDLDHGGMSWKDVRDAARLHIGDTGLLDYVLKSLNNVIVGNQVVCRSVNPTTHILEYTVHDLKGGNKVSEPEKETLPLPPPSAAPVPGNNVYTHVLYLYEQVLLGYPESELVELAAQAVLDTKHFVKECSFGDENEQLMTLFCQILPSLTDKEIEFKREFPPGEMVVMPLNATVGELKQEAESSLRDTYCITERFVVTEIKGLEESDDMDALSGAVQSGTEVQVRGSGIDLDTPLRYQGGSETWMVRCECGATDDDGERMVCDICEACQPTRCCGMVSVPRIELFFECLNRGTTNVCLCFGGLIILVVDSRTSRTKKDTLGKNIVEITNEDYRKVRFFGNFFATMSGYVWVCEAVWDHMELFLTRNPNATLYDVSKSAFAYVKENNFPGCAMFIGGIEGGVTMLYQLDHDVMEDIKYFRERLKLLKGHYFAIGSGSEFAVDVLKNWDNSMVDSARDFARKSVLEACLKEIHSGGHVIDYSWDVAKRQFQKIGHQPVMVVYRQYFDTRLEDQVRGLFVMYGGKLSEEDIKSIPHVTYHGHQLGISTSGLIVRLMWFEEESYRDRFYDSALPLTTYPPSFFDGQGMLDRKYRHLQHMRYHDLNGELLLVAKPCKPFVYSLETTAVVRVPFFSDYLC